MQWRFTLSNPTYGTTVIDEPIGWADISINVKRDMTSHGLFFDHVVSLKFIDNGRVYLKNAYNTGGIDQYVELKIEVKCSDTDVFSDFYIGKIFLAKLIFDCSDYCFAEAPIEPAGCLMKFRNRIDQKVDLQLCEDYDKNVLPCYNFLPYKIKMKPKLVIRNTKGVINEKFSNCIQYDDEITANTTDCGNDLQQTVYIEPKIDSYTINEVLTTNALGGTFSAVSSSVMPFIKANNTGVYEIDIKINPIIHAFYDANTSHFGSNPTCGCSGLAQIGNLNPNFTANLFHKNDCLINAYFNPAPSVRNNGIKINDVTLEFFVNINGVEVNSLLLHNTSGGCFDFFEYTSCFTYSNTYNLNKDDVLKIYFKLYTDTETKRRVVGNVDLWKIYGYTQLMSSVSCTDTHISVKTKVLLPPTDSKVYMINEAFSRVTENITNDCLRVKSNYFGRTDSQPYTSNADGCGALESLTVGKHLRQFPDNLCLMNPSFKDLFESMNAIHNIGYGLEPDANRAGFEWLRIEPMAYWYDNTVLMTCDNIPDMKRRVMAEWYISLFNFGYEKWEAEQTSGLDEFAVKKQYRTTFKEIKNEISQRVKFIGSGYSIENTRTEAYSEDSTKDWRWDNDIFVICVRRDGTAIAPYSLISVEQGIDCINVPTAANIIDPATIYNARISPNRNFLRWLPYLMANYAHNINDALSYFRFVDGEGNFLAEMELINGCLYEKTGKNLKENEDISVSDTNNINQSKPIFKFELIDFDYPMSFAQFNIIKSNPRGLIEYRGTDMTTLESGYIYSIAYKPNIGIATFTILPKYI